MVKTLILRRMLNPPPPIQLGLIANLLAELGLGVGLQQLVSFLGFLIPRYRLLILREITKKVDYREWE